MYGQDILCGISKVTFEIPYKIYYPYIEICVFYSQVKMQGLLYLKARKRFWNAPRTNPVLRYDKISKHFLFVFGI